MPENEKPADSKDQKAGTLCAVASMVLWGFLPIYWKALAPISSTVIVLYRITLAGTTSAAASLAIYGTKGVREVFKNKKTVLQLFVAGVIITLNWSTYVYAVTSGKAIQASIGYYIEPLMICAFGMLLFHERLTKYKLFAIILASAGVLVIILHSAQFPLLALFIALTFTVYTALKKHMRMPALLSLFFETVFLAPAAMLCILCLEAAGNGALSAGSSFQFILLMPAGLLTAAPLTLFAVAANRISLISIGIIEYISPSIMLAIGVFLFKESFDLVQLAALIIIWIGLVVFTYGEIKGQSAARRL